MHSNGKNPAERVNNRKDCTPNVRPTSCLTRNFSSSFPIVCLRLCAGFVSCGDAARAVLRL
jgi:hypothetical protein